MLVCFSCFFSKPYLEANQSLSTELIDLDTFRKKVLLSYAIIEKDKLVSFTEAYTSGKGEIEKIVHEAKEQRTNWESVVQLFNERFTVPFKIIISNKEDVILKDEAASVAFKYTDNGEEKIIGKDDLIAVLSVGERRAYHLLNVIYEIENRKNKSEKTILIIDDIADSFDYKNKYAIIQYLKDLSRYTDFYQIILTHNFDFFKTVQSRLHIGRHKNCHMVIKETYQIKLVQAQYMDPFKYFRDNINKDHKIAIAAIPFFRNIAEYTQGVKSETYLKLTSLLHIKNDTETITVSDYGTLVNQLINTSFVLKDGNKKVIELIFEVASLCNNGIESINLEKKIVLSIAIRLKAEKFIITHLGVGCLDGIETNQTVELSFKYSNAFPDNVEVIKILERVVLMTPENIHLNSFMYEPLLDMSDHHLCDLFDKVRSLSFPNCNPV